MSTCAFSRKHQCCKGAESVEGNPRTSVRHRSQQLEISNVSLHKILHEDLNLHPYKVQLTQKFEACDHTAWEHFANFVLQNQELDPMFAKRIIFSDEAHFHLDGYVNKQNCRLWATENPQEIHEKSLHPNKCTVWCGFWNGVVIGPYFFENENGVAVTVNGERYRRMITEFLLPQLEDLEEDLWFQQDGATCHTARQTTQLLRDKFPDRLISSNGDYRWPPRSCDLSPLDFFLWGFVKSRAYKSKPNTIAQLKNEIRNVISEITQNLC